MSDIDQVVCARCGGTNRPTASRCWVCYSALGAEAGPAPDGTPAATLQVAAKKKTNNPLITALKIVIVLSCVIAMIPVLLIVTCFGILIFNPPNFH